MLNINYFHFFSLFYRSNNYFSYNTFSLLSQSKYIFLQYRSRNVQLTFICVNIFSWIKYTVNNWFRKLADISSLVFFYSYFVKTRRKIICYHYFRLGYLNLDISVKHASFLGHFLFTKHCAREWLKRVWRNHYLIS